jgi:hypothetical protein
MVRERLKDLATPEEIRVTERPLAMQIHQLALNLDELRVAGMAQACSSPFY